MPWRENKKMNTTLAKSGSESWKQQLVSHTTENFKLAVISLRFASAVSLQTRRVSAPKSKNKMQRRKDKYRPTKPRCNFKQLIYAKDPLFNCSYTLHALVCRASIELSPGFHTQASSTRANFGCHRRWDQRKLQTCQ
jgi:hypothetical protein